MTQIRQSKQTTCYIHVLEDKVYSFSMWARIEFHKESSQIELIFNSFVFKSGATEFITLLLKVRYEFGGKLCLKTMPTTQLKVEKRVSV